MNMLMLALIPYTIILFGIALGYIGVRPTMLAWAAYMFGALSGLGLAVGILTLSHSASWPHAAIAFLPFAFVASMTVKDLTYPLINDVTTDTTAPPSFLAAQDISQNAGRDMTFPERFGPIVCKRYPNLRPLLLDEPKQVVFKHAFRLMKAKPRWKITRVDREHGELEAEVTTPLLRFVDDVVVRVSDQTGATRVDMRSKSREGLVDGGYNARRVSAFFQQLAEGNRDA